MFNIYDNNNNKINCEVLFTFSKNNNNFIVYKDETEDLLASFYEIIENKMIITPIEDDEDFDLVDKELNKLGEQ